jgi:hypothetical protein
LKKLNQEKKPSWAISYRRGEQQWSCQIDIASSFLIKKMPHMFQKHEQLGAKHHW